MCDVPVMVQFVLCCYGSVCDVPVMVQYVLCRYDAVCDVSLCFSVCCVVMVQIVMCPL